MHVTGMTALDEAPVDMMTVVDKEKYLYTIAGKVVDLVWQDVDSESVLKASHTVEEFPFCTCREDLGDDATLIECSGFRCPGNNWYHLDCIGMDQDDVPDEDFYCSEDCKKRREFRYCCHIDLEDETMIACDNKNCEKEWFHMKCLGMKTAPKGKWYCSKKCRTAKKKKTKGKSDHKFNYVTSLLFCGLMDMVRRDAVRENDGEAMMSHWRYDMIQFFNRNHPKYVLLAHRLLAGVAGWLPARLARDSVWNRTINLAGGPGRSLEADLVNEFLNKEFKDSLKDARGNITEETVLRYSQMVGSMGRVLDTIFCSSMDLDTKDFIKKQTVSMTVDLETFVTLLGKEKFFKESPGREFKAFPEFEYSVNCLQPGRLNSKLTQLSKRLDKIRRCCE